MELFYSKDIADGLVRLSEEESAHCVRVLRHRPGDEIAVMDGKGSLQSAYQHCICHHCPDCLCRSNQHL